ncbi:hypothetical protein ES703_121188 [subsurface metagenome]
MEAHSFRSTHLAFIMILAFFFRPLGRKSWRAPIRWTFYVDMALILLIIGIQVYTLWDIEEFIWRRGDLTDWDIRAGTILILLLLEATRRVVGWAMVIIASFFLIQTAFSDHFFGILYGPPNSWFTILDYIFMRENGIYGIPIMVMATYIFLFILFGSILIRSGAGRFFINLALSVTGHRIGGPAKASIVSSALMATVSGSAVANVVTTGSFTIPLMKKVGYRPHFAGAVEACASSGGQIMPPVMGAAAFIIAEFLAVPYLKVCVGAMVPATLYFFSILVMVHFEAIRHDLGALSKADLPDFRKEAKRGGASVDRPFGDHCCFNSGLYTHVCGLSGHPLYLCIEFPETGDPDEPHRHPERLRGWGHQVYSRVRCLCLCRHHHRVCLCFGTGTQIYQPDHRYCCREAMDRLSTHHDRLPHLRDGVNDDRSLYHRCRLGCPILGDYGG